MGGDLDGTLYKLRDLQPVERRAERERQPQRQRLERQLVVWGPSLISSFLPLLFARGVLFTSSLLEWFY